MLTWGGLGDLKMTLLEFGPGAVVQEPLNLAHNSILFYLCTEELSFTRHALNCHIVINGVFIRNKSVCVHEDTKVAECTRTRESNIYDLIHEDTRINEYMKYPLGR